MAVARKRVSPAACMWRVAAAVLRSWVTESTFSRALSFLGSHKLPGPARSSLPRPGLTLRTLPSALNPGRGAIATTITNVEIGTTKPRGPDGAGHRAVWLEHGADNLVSQ